GGTMSQSDEVVVRVIARIHCAHAIEFPHLNRGEQVVHGKRVVRMTQEDALEILNRRVVVEVVIVLKGSLIQRIIGAEISRAEISRTKRGRNRRIRCQTNRCQAKLGKQQHCANRSGAMPEEEEKHASSV